LQPNIDIGLQYLESWLRGNGCVPIYDLMEDAATAEISRSQVWQWIHYAAKMNDGRVITPQLFDQLLGEVVERLKAAETTPKDNKFDRAAELFTTMSKGEFEEFLTSVAYGDLA
jgi:malate synthase